MKTIISIISLGFIILQSSCSNNPSDEKLLTSISELEKERISKYADILMGSPCGYFKSLKIPKIYTYNSYPEDNQLYKQIMDDFALNKLISMKHLTEKDVLGTHIIGNQRSNFTMKTYEISLMDEGTSIMLGENGDDFILRKYDSNQISIVEKKYNKANDTLTVKYSNGRTKLQQILAKFCPESGQIFLARNDTSIVTLIYNKKDWKLLK